MMPFKLYHQLALKPQELKSHMHVIVFCFSVPSIKNWPPAVKLLLCVEVKGQLLGLSSFFPSFFEAGT